MSQQDIARQRRHLHVELDSYTLDIMYASYLDALCFAKRAHWRRIPPGYHVLRVSILYILKAKIQQGSMSSMTHLEQFPQRLDQLELKVLRQAPNIVMRLDGVAVFLFAARGRT